MSNRKQSHRLLWYGVIIVIIAFVLFGTAWGGVISQKIGPSGLNITTSTQHGGATTIISGQGTGSALPITFSVLDKWAGGGVNAPTVNVYNGQVKTDSGSASSAGIYTTSGTYVPGQQLNVEVIKSNAMQYYTVTVPSTASLVSSSDVYPITLNFWTLGTYTFTVVDNYGNTYSNGACFNFTAGTGSQCGGSSVAAKPGVATATLSVQIYDTVTNTGYTSSYDPINNVQWSAYVEISSAGAASISGYGSSVQRGSTTYYLTQVPDSALQCVQVGQVISGCSTSVSFTVGAGNIAHGSSETESLYLKGYFSPTWFAANGVGSPNVYQLQTTTVKLAK